MPEIPNPHGLEFLKDKYAVVEPDFWAINFVESVRTDEIETQNGTEHALSTDFAYYIFKEAADLTIDTAMTDDPNRSASTVKFLGERGRIDPEHEVKFYSVSRKDYSALIGAIRRTSAYKLIALTDYLTHQGDLAAVPLAFLTGRTGGIFSDKFINFGEEDWIATKQHFSPYGKYYRNRDEDRGQIMRKAKKLYENGGRVLFPYFVANEILNAFVEPQNEGEPAQVGFGFVPQYMESRLKIAGKVSDERQILAMLHPKELTEPD